MRKILFLLLFFTVIVPALAAADLDFDCAWKRVLSYAPTLEASRAEVEAKRAEMLQVSLLPNPVATVESENLGIRNRNDDAEPPETTFAITQLIETAGKRCARRNFASSLTDLAFLDAEIARMDLRLALLVAFIDVALAQERVRLADQSICIAEKIVEANLCLLEGGKATPLQLKKAEISLRSAEIERKEAGAELSQTKKRLSSLWGSPCPDFDQVIFDLFQRSAPQGQENALAALFQTPDFARAKQQVDASVKNIKLQKANSFPDFTLTLGYSVFHDSGQGGWLVAAEMPLPIFDRNQGNIRKAFVEKSQAEYGLDELVRALSEKVLLAHERVCAAFEASQMLECGVLAEAFETYALIEEGYECGKLEYVEVLDAERTLCELQESFLGILYDYHISAAELCRLTGEWVYNG